jgi:hypothetical protein
MVMRASRELKIPTCTLRLALSTIVPILACVLIACAAPAPPLLTVRIPPNRIFEEDDIREAVFQYLIEIRKFPGQVFLSIDGNDPSDAFMSRFSDEKNFPTKISRSYFKKDPFPGWLRDRTTNEKGVGFNVSSISWISTIEVEVKGGSYCGGLCADAGVFKVTKKNGRWKVDYYRIRLVS